MLTLGIQYLTGYAVATDSGNYYRTEWPPHPARIFMALAAAYFESKPSSKDRERAERWREEGEALRWLETLEAPLMKSPAGIDREICEVYVPPNDMGPTQRSVIPVYRTNRQARTFPKVWLDSDTVFLTWKKTLELEKHLGPLSRLCRKVIRVGHSSSLVQVWIEADENRARNPNLVPISAEEAGRGALRLRIPVAGTLNYLKEQYNGEAVEMFYDYTVRLQRTKGRERRLLAAEFQKEFNFTGNGNPPRPMSRRPEISMTQAYQPISGEDESRKFSKTVFDDNLFVLTQQEGPVLGLESTWRVITALRGAIEANCQPTPEWVNGHQVNGKPSDSPHLAFLPLAFVDHENADGHLMGIAAAFPRFVSFEQRGNLIGKLLYDEEGRQKAVRLTLGKLGVWTLQEEERPSPPFNLRSSTWTRPSTTFASVSPVVLDRHPKKDALKDRKGFIQEVREIVSQSCQRIGLPTPVEIDIDKTSWFIGAPRSKPGANGYPLMPVRPGGPNRRQVHVWLRFENPVVGPITIGAGRYRGYGFCRPIHFLERSVT